ncbi:restriction endonuclease subunit S [Opitutus terrae]|uniref:Restriction modification system DNA specificity domain n=1 Tax=Opitutus terrae (strain DSM 11246 / JCM 15787 / PB90-1) TaxID=452637 RepID=B1ZMN0_OPITP|nr:restriction endonuclease subunit S [Opitutus terrae]ACB74375.1 restriction modification system DNA specificity domain [Opitutus terrae PB90-1]
MTRPTATPRDPKPALTPKLRFPEFRDGPAWETQTLGSLVTISTERVGDNKCVPMSITSGVGLVSQMEKFGRVIAGDSYKNYLLLKKNDFAYNKSATKEYPEGFIARYSGEALAAVPNSIFTCFRINGDSPIPEYLNYLFLGNLHGQWLRKFIEVGARAHGSLSIDEDDLLALPVPLPAGRSSRAEQQKIAGCLGTLDELIGAESQNLDALKAHKKGLMRQLFPREGETLPRLRFAEFHSAPKWEMVPLGAIAEIKLGKMLDCQKHTTGLLLPYLNNIAIRWNAVDTSNLPEMYFDDHELDRFGLKAGDVVVCEGGEPGRAAVWDGRLPDLKFQKAVHRVRFNVPFEPHLLVQYLEAIAGTPQFEKLFTGGGIKHLTRETFAKLEVPLISESEQHRIATCLSSLDDLIAAQSDRLVALQTHKQGLLQQLFPPSSKTSE